MTNTTITLKKLEVHVWNNGGVWQRARIAYRHNAMGLLTRAELTELVNTLGEVNFIANMSDDYRVTLREIAENEAIVKEAKELLGNPTWL